MGTWYGWTPLESFMAKVSIRDDGCWEWTATRNRKGYGNFRGRMAHRWIYQELVGPVPSGLELDHFKCNRTWCVNPDHVRPVSSRENSLRGNNMGSRNAAKTHCVNGHPLVAENLYLKSGYRRCAVCCRERGRDPKRVAS